jgi:hypothetical protein
MTRLSRCLRQRQPSFRRAQGFQGHLRRANPAQQGIANGVGGYLLRHRDWAPPMHAGQLIPHRHVGLTERAASRPAIFRPTRRNGPRLHHLDLAAVSHFSDPPYHNIGRTRSLLATPTGHQDIQTALVEARHGTGGDVAFFIAAKSSPSGHRLLPVSATSVRRPQVATPPMR